MICDDIRDILKGDFLDGQLSLEEREVVLRHLTQCPACQAFEKTLQIQRRVFQQAKRQDVPRNLWENIQREIIAKELKEKDGIGNRMVRWGKEFLFAPKPVFTLGSTFAAIIFLVTIIAGVTMHKKQMSRSGNTAILASYNVNLESTDILSNLGTDIEKFFL